MSSATGLTHATPAAGRVRVERYEPAKPAKAGVVSGLDGKSPYGLDADNPSFYMPVQALLSVLNST